MTEIAIVGGGLAGAQTAALLARLGSRPVVFERRPGPADKVCGEFLSAEAQERLAAVGLDVGALGAVKIEVARLAAGRRMVGTRLPFPAFGVSRRALDEALLAHAEALGAIVRRGVVVRSIDEGLIRTDEGVIRPARIVLASGKHDVRGARRIAPGADLGLVGFKAYFALRPAMRTALEGAVEIVFFEGGYAGLQLVEDGRANLCLLIQRERLGAVGGNWPALPERLKEEPHLRTRLEDAVPGAERPLAVAGLPFGFRHSRSGPETLFRVGDQAAVTDAFTGDGMAIALHSACLAARALAEDAGANAYHARLAADLARPVGLASWLRRRAQAWPVAQLAVIGLGLCPPLVAQLARWTRVPKNALARSSVPWPTVDAWRRADALPGCRAPDQGTLGRAGGGSGTKRGR